LRYSKVKANKLLVMQPPASRGALIIFDRSFHPTMPADIRDQRYQGWRDAMARTVLEPVEK
jgi:hypothetical protein